MKLQLFSVSGPRPLSNLYIIKVKGPVKTIIKCAAKVKAALYEIWDNGLQVHVNMDVVI
ncbi:hypothetical protein HanHA89_Chr16g0681891 [Helianthus annuus]|nr:hypothetical protein HanHA89_Chr16g0681891 [Helianthus annuus]